MLIGWLIVNFAGNDGGYVQPPENIHQTTGLSGDHQAVVGQQYVAHAPMTYAISQKVSIKDGDWAIVDQNGNSSFKVSGKIASMRDKRYLKDAAGNKILTLKKKLITMHNSWEILAGDGGNVLATCKKSSLVQVKTAMDVMLASSTSGKNTPDYQVKGDFFNYNIAIYRGTEEAAVVWFHFNHSFPKLSYFVSAFWSGD